MHFLASVPDFQASSGPGPFGSSESLSFPGGLCCVQADELPARPTSAATESRRRSMRLSRYFLPILRETPKEAEIVSHRLMLRAGMIRQEAAGIYAWLPLGLRVLNKINADRPRGAEPRRRHRAPDADHPIGRPLARSRAATTPTARRCCASQDRHERDMLFGPTNEEMITEIFRALRAVLQGSAAEPLPHPVEVPRRGAAALRRDARARVPDEGRLFVRSRPGGARAFLQQDVRRLSAHLRAAWG